MAPEISKGISLGNYFHKICNILAEDKLHRQVYKFNNKVNIEFIKCHNQYLEQKYFLLLTVALTYINCGLSADNFVWKGSQLGNILQQSIKSIAFQGNPKIFIYHMRLFIMFLLLYLWENVSSLSVPYFLKYEERNWCWITFSKQSLNNFWRMGKLKMLLIFPPKAIETFTTRANNYFSRL